MVRHKPQMRIKADDQGWLPSPDYPVQVRWDNQQPKAERRLIEIKLPDDLIAKVTRVLSGKKWELDGGTQLFELQTAEGVETFKTFHELMQDGLEIKPR